MPLVNFANLIAASFADSTKTFAQRALARMQLTTGQMPPAPNVRATAAEIQAMSNWIAAGYPNTGCGTGAGGSTGAGGATGVGGRTGTGGATGTGGRTGTGGAGGGGGATAAGLPCDVQAVYQTHCTTCHAATPVNGAPMPLVTRANLMASSFADASMTFAQRTVVRMQSTTSPMPPAPGTRATTAEVQTVNTWISAGYPAGTCSVGGAGGAGGTADPLGAAARCTSGTTWTGGNDGNPMMNPGRACISCHAGEEDAPRFTIAGTLYPTGHEPNLCNGVNGTTGARVVIVDAANRTVTLTPNAAGNFMYTGAISTPYHRQGDLPGPRADHAGRADQRGLQFVPYADRGQRSARADHAAVAVFPVPLRTGAGDRNSAEQLIRRDRQIAHAHAGRVIDRVRDRRRRAGDADLADALRADGVDDRVGLVDRDDLDRGHVQVHRHVVVGEIARDHAAGPADRARSPRAGPCRCPRRSRR